MRFKWLILKGWQTTLPEDLGEHTSQMVGECPKGGFPEELALSWSCRQARKAAELGHFVLCSDLICFPTQLA